MCIVCMLMAVYVYIHKCISFANCLGAGGAERSRPGPQLEASGLMYIVLCMCIVYVLIAVYVYIHMCILFANCLGSGGTGRSRPGPLISNGIQGLIRHSR